MHYDRLAKSICALMVGAALLCAGATNVVADKSRADVKRWHPKIQLPLITKEQGNFFVGGTLNDDGRISGQMYVEYQVPLVQKQKYPLIFVHGGGQIGAAWWSTPDGRPGWAQYFLRQGYAVYVVDQPARGRSAYNSQLGALSNPTDVLTAQRLFVAPERFNLWPAARLHTRWVGTPEPGDETFDQFMKSQSDALTDSLVTQEPLTADGLIALLDRIGPAILVLHSQPGFPSWVVADRRPNLVKAMVELEPGGPPVAFGPPLIVPGIPLPYGLTVTPLTYSPPVSDPSELQFVSVPIEDPYVESCLLQAEPARQLPNIQKVPILLLTSEAGYNTMWDPCTHAYLEQAGVRHTWIRLPDIGIFGNAHFMFIENNSDQVAGVVLQWLKQTVRR